MTEARRRFRNGPGGTGGRGEPPSLPALAGRLPLARALRAGAQLSATDLVDLAELTAVLVFVEVMVRKVPVARLAGWLGVTLRLSVAEGPEPAGLPAVDFTLHERRKTRLARRLVAYWPFGAGPCLRETLIVGHTLRRHHPAMRLGVARDGRVVTAHAWLEVGGISLEADRGYVPLGPRP